MRQTQRTRAKPLPSADREEAILRAALAVFTEKGFAAARVEDVAREAGIAKGTVYLYFNGKEALFKALIQTAIALRIEGVEGLLAAYRGSAEALLRLVVDVLRREMLETDRRLVVQLVLTEAHRFPELAEYYHDTVVSRGLRLVRTIIERGVENGEFADDALARFPQLIVGPFLVAVIWQALFARHAALDADGMIRTHLDLLMRAIRKDPP